MLDRSEFLESNMQVLDVSVSIYICRSVCYLFCWILKLGIIVIYM
jgi:hypothetical protein